MSRKKGFARIKKLPAFGRRRAERAPAFAPVVPEAPGEADGLADLARRLDGDMQLAKRIARLQAQYPAGSVPELVTYDWLSRNRVQFEYQVSLFGGRRAVRGVGLVPDFVIFGERDGAAVWQIQGEYWHSIALKGNKDEVVRLRMLGSTVRGSKVKAVLELWEDDILHKRPQVFQLAMVGVELRR